MFNVSEYERLWIKGPTGCGKTTLLNMMAGFLPTPENTVFSWNSKVFHHLPTEKRNLSYLMQHEHVFLGLSLKNQCKLVAHAAQFRQYIDDLFPNMNFSRKGEDLSGGERQAIGCMRVLAEKRPILLLDEPFTHLDPQLKEKVIHLILNYQRHTSCVIVYTSHQQHEENWHSTQVYTL